MICPGKNKVLNKMSGCGYNGNNIRFSIAIRLKTLLHHNRIYSREVLGGISNKIKGHKCEFSFFIVNIQKMLFIYINNDVLL